jgi:hypothetical protein
MAKQSERQQKDGLVKIVLCLATLLAACAPAVANRALPDSPVPVESSTPAQGAATALPVTPTPYSSAPEDDTLDITCRITINHFFNFREGFDVEEYRKLFFLGGGDLANAYITNPPTQARTILALMPASEWWQKRAPGTPIPGSLLPERPNEYTYSVEYTGYYDSDETPFYAYPDYMTMIMFSDGPYSCKIINYGKG